MKRLIVKKIDKIQGYWTVIETEVADLKKDHKTHMRIDKVIYDRDLPDQLFSQSVLQEAARETPYHP